MEIKVLFSKTCVGPEAESRASSPGTGEVLLQWKPSAFNPEETEGDLVFSELGTIFVNDALELHIEAMHQLIIIANFLPK